MDAQAHLISLGWAGPGHALDSRPQYKQKGHRGLAYNPAHDPLKVGNTGTGLVKPLSISKRKDRFGIGKRSHEPVGGTEWWLKGFESALGNIGKSESERSGTATPVMGSLGLGMKHSGLYGFFIKGQVMEGTISEEVLLEHSRGRKRKSDALDDSEPNILNGNGGHVGGGKVRKTGLEVSPVRRKPETALDFARVGAFMRERDAAEKKRNGTDVKQNETDQFAQIGKFFEESEKTERKKKKRKSEYQALDPVADAIGENFEVGINGRVETKEERRERRRKRKEEKARLASLGEDTRNDGNSIPDLSEEKEIKAARKAEERRKKVERGL